MSLTQSTSEYLTDTTFTSKHTFFKKLLIRKPGVAWFCSKDGKDYANRSPANKENNVNLLVPNSLLDNIPVEDSNTNITSNIPTPHVAIDQFCIAIRVTKEFQDISKFEFGIPLVLTYRCNTQALDDTMHLLKNDVKSYYSHPVSDTILYDKTIELTSEQLVKLTTPATAGSNEVIVIKDTPYSSSLMFYTYPFKRLMITPLDNQTVTIDAYIKTNSKVSIGKYSYVDIDKYVSACNISVLLCSDDYKSEITSL